MTSRSTERRHQKNREAVVAWTHPVGTRVKVRRANGRDLTTWPETTAFLVDNAHAFIRVQGIPGNTRLDRVRVARKRAAK